MHNCIIRTIRNTLPYSQIKRNGGGGGGGGGAGYVAPDSCRKGSPARLQYFLELLSDRVEKLVNSALINTCHMIHGGGDRVSEAGRPYRCLVRWGNLRFIGYELET